MKRREGVPTSPPGRKRIKFWNVAWVRLESRRWVSITLAHQDMSRRQPPNGTPRRPPQQHFLSDSESEALESTDNALSKSFLRKLHLECFDECIYNDLPQYLVRVSDMRLYSRGELWKTFRSHLRSVNINLEDARQMMESDGEAQLRENCKVASISFRRLSSES